MYAVHIKRWLEYFPLSQIHVVHGEKFIRQPWHELAKIERFLNLPSEIKADQVRIAAMPDDNTVNFG